MSQTNMEIIVELITDDEYNKFEKSYNKSTGQFTYTPVPERHYVETYPGIAASFPINFQISDVADISSRSSSYSQTITVPATKANDRIFSQIGSLGYTKGSKFNPKRAMKATVLQDTIIVFEGYMQFLESDNIGEDGHTEYQLVIFTIPFDFFNALGDYKLSDLDYSDVVIKYNRDTLINSWDPNKSYPYFFPAINYWDCYDTDLGDVNHNDKGWYVENFYPALYTKYLWDKIFAFAGYRCHSDFSKTYPFINEIAVYNGASIMTRRDINEINPIYNFGADKDFVAYNSVSYSYSTVPGNTSAAPFNDVGIAGVKQFRLAFDNTFNPNYQYAGANTWAFDTNTSHNSTWSTYQNNSTEGFKQKFLLTLEMSSPSTDSAGLSALDQNDTDITKIEIILYREFDESYSTPGTGYAFNSQYRGNILSRFVVKDTSGVEEPGEGITWGIASTGNKGFRVDIDFGVLNNYSYLDFQPNANIGIGEHIRVNVLFTTTKNFIYQQSANCVLSNVVYTDITYNSTLDINNIVADVKLSDFIMEVVHRHNLYVEPDPIYPHTLNIEPRDVFYSKGINLNWSKKLDASKDIKIQPLANNTSRITNFTFKQDSDYLSKYYLKYLGQSYGDYIYDDLNEFSKDVTTISSICASTILSAPRSAGGVTDYVMPAIYSGDLPVYPGVPTLTFAKSELRFMQVRRANGNGEDKRQPLTSNVFRLRYPFNNTEPGTGNLWTQYSWYPYAGNLDNPNAPTYDNNWAQPSDYFYNTLTYGFNTTQNTAVKTYWNQYLTELYDQESKLVTMYLHLTPSDISALSLANKIFIQVNNPKLQLNDGAYFKFNKIISYNPAAPSVCQVEFIYTTFSQVSSYSTGDYQEEQPVFHTNALRVGGGGMTGDDGDEMPDDTGNDQPTPEQPVVPQDVLDIIARKERNGQLTTLLSGAVNRDRK